MELVVAGIVLFNPDIDRLRKNIDAIINQVKAIIVFDNGSSNIKSIKKGLADYPNIEFLCEKKNVGIAAALNRIFNYAIKSLHADYVLTLDQDTVCPENLINEYLKFYNRDVGIYSPRIKDINADVYLEDDNDHSEVTAINKCITSASLTSVIAWHIVNGFDETMFIDNVDFDFCNRIRKKGFEIYRINSVFVNHELGHIRTYKTPFGNILVKNHSAFRKYYIARNIIYMSRKDNSSLFIAYLRVIKQLILVVAFESDKIKKIQSILKGMQDGQKAIIVEKWH
ncbi:glycosyltransferase family 2 protein [Limosilactobacillus fermentum]|uniref:glycosyltransferase family 2 protein n=1 Tax=Limosilactobacillus fermentum TaxID=1613 RepID=UPI0021A5F480|nr:glycosyltransferase family 2 protein [Limosilactobacillus fermentum]MCT2918579.1 glycosyltransferase family 2 protein [Limosilactobacillus fermentum]